MWRAHQPHTFTHNSTGVCNRYRPTLWLSYSWTCCGDQQDKSCTKNESFWSMYVVKKSPADGHCFMHSLVSCINSRMTTMTPCDNLTLFKHLRSEIVTNSAYYLSFIKGGTYSDLHTMNFQWKKRFREMALWACAVARVPGKLCQFA